MLARDETTHWKHFWQILDAAVVEVDGKKF
jgi:hypothetical protein